ncbi:MAG: radical SAM family heme chaperone HemW [Muribaculaceae bacterium]|nr:radical SAM family heme chaperone HemW [Muribaculaceae bacterium]
MLYLHLPFCHSKCIYCDFFSTPLARSMYGDYVEAMLAETAFRISELKNPPTSVYIGGGTPSILPNELTERLLSGLLDLIDIKAVKEWTVEMNPEDVTPELLDLYALHGVNRISMGVQSFHNSTLKRIGRRHSATQAIDAINLIQERGFNHSFDLIYGLPDEDLTDWIDSLDKLLNFRPDHFSAYLLSYEPGTALCKMMEQGRISETPEELAIEMYDLLCDRAKCYGYEHYEISNFALPGHRSYHNSRYWNGTPYLGIGCSAHSFTNGTRKSNPADIQGYITSITEGNLCYEEEMESCEEQFNDLIITSLRTSDGMDIEQVKRFPEYIATEFSENMNRQLRRGNLISSGNRLTIPEKRWLEADAVMRELLV